MAFLFLPFGPPLIVTYFYDVLEVVKVWTSEEWNYLKLASFSVLFFQYYHVWHLKYDNSKF